MSRAPRAVKVKSYDELYTSMIAACDRCVIIIYAGAPIYIQYNTIQYNVILPTSSHIKVMQL